MYSGLSASRQALEHSFYVSVMTTSRARHRMWPWVGTHCTPRHRITEKATLPHKLLSLVRISWQWRMSARARIWSLAHLGSIPSSLRLSPFRTGLTLCVPQFLGRELKAPSIRTSPCVIQSISTREDLQVSQASWSWKPHKWHQCVGGADYALTENGVKPKSDNDITKRFYNGKTENGITVKW
jgi:hypothetical protein